MDLVKINQLCDVASLPSVADLFLPDDTSLSLSRCFCHWSNADARSYCFSFISSYKFTFSFSISFFYSFFSLVGRAAIGELLQEQ